MGLAKAKAKPGLNELSNFYRLLEVKRLMDLLPEPKLHERAWLYVKAHWKWLVPITVVVLAAAGYLIYTLTSASAPLSPSQNQPAASEQPQPTTVASPLTGLQVDPKLAKQRVLGVMIENFAGVGGARPQSGLSLAGIVFETVAEGGITRYLTLFQETRPKLLGPVRSLRPYYLDWAQGFDAPFAHAGGSGTALWLVAHRHAMSINALNYGPPYFWRTADRIAPHNLYTSTVELDKLADKLGYTKTSNFVPYKRTTSEAPAVKPLHSDLKFDFSGPDYKTEWRYQKSTNTYLRYLAGTADVDRATHKQIRAKNIVYIDMPLTYKTESGHTYSDLKDIGSGTAIVFRDGRAIKCTWSKNAPSEPLRLKDATGQDIALNPGISWFEIVPHGQPVSY